LSDLYYVEESAVRPAGGRGRHRPVRPAAGRRISARAAVAVVTTGSIASGVAFAGYAAASGSDTNTDATTAGLLTAGARPGSGSSAGYAASPEQTRTVRPVTLVPKDNVRLRVDTADVTTTAGAPVEVSFGLYDATRGVPVVGQTLRLQVQRADGWATFRYLKADARGRYHYTARVLATTHLRAVFDGTATLRAAVASNVGTLRVAAPAEAGGQASRASTRAPITTQATAAAPAAAPAPAPASSLGERAVYLASLQAGKPYVWGGSGPYNFDCSGLVQYVFKQLGRSLPRTTNEQYAAVTKVPQAAKQPGDLIFFGTPGDIYHMGIYAGNNQIWAAPSSGNVVKLQTLWTTSYLVGRVL
jgi:peptidoglycan DL-endopeptidase CwlO